eukprot:CAMPEP_0172453988 /NCGR_PEP_ID=MMETSP1065-20121228/11107_1 /TAXON_ID=265537 /ORGANISM="Amphiprora paludosa, Strain CCMP125" /LENGTH=255 /DNA_ID=CAMNT_0013206239 /DNA_START=38 /DNA_END=805 /DNA_ORIENTATION=+
MIQQVASTHSRKQLLQSFRSMNKRSKNLLNVVSSSSSSTASMDDDASQDSTFCARRNTPKSSLLEQTADIDLGPPREIRRRQRRAAPVKATNKQVTFNERQNRVVATAANHKHSNVCWFSPQELSSFRKETMRQSKKLIQSTSSTECNFRRVVTSIYSTCCAVPMELENGRRFLCPADTHDFQKCLHKTLDTTLGLDRLVVQILRQEAKSNRQQIRALLQQQKHLNDETLRQAILPLSRPARLYARELARGLEHC